MISTSSQDEITGTIFTLLPKTTKQQQQQQTDKKYKTMVFRHWILGNERQWYLKEGSK